MTVQEAENWQGKPPDAEEGRLGESLERRGPQRGLGAWRARGVRCSLGAARTQPLPQASGLPAQGHPPPAAPCVCTEKWVLGPGVRKLGYGLTYVREMFLSYLQREGNGRRKKETNIHVRNIDLLPLLCIQTGD